MKTIQLASFTTEAASKSKGELLKEHLELLIQEGEDIIVDFNGIKRFASPFFNNSFAALALAYGFDVIKKIQLLNITETGQHTYETSLDNALLISENPQFSDEIDRIVNNTPKKADEL